MDFYVSRRKFVGFPDQQTHHLASVRKSAGQYEDRKLKPDHWARAVFRQGKTHNIVFFVHGYNNSHIEVVARLRRVRAGLKKAGFNGEVVGFEWPSHNVISDYVNDKKRARQAAPFLVTDGMELLKRVNPAARISVMAHSMGNFVLATALRKKPVGQNGIGQILSVASDVARRDMRAGQDEAEAFARSCERLTNYRSQRDDVLDLSAKLFNGRRRRSGREGIDNRAPATFHNVSCSLRYFTFVPPRDRTSSKSHNWYFDDKRFYRDAVAILASKDHTNLPTRQLRPNGEIALRP